MCQFACLWSKMRRVEKNWLHRRFSCWHDLLERENIRRKENLRGSACISAQIMIMLFQLFCFSMHVCGCVAVWLLCQFEDVLKSARESTQLHPFFFFFGSSLSHLTFSFFPPCCMPPSAYTFPPFFFYHVDCVLFSACKCATFFFFFRIANLKYCYSVECGDRIKK